MNEARYYEIERIPRASPLTAKRNIEFRKHTPIRYFSDLKKVVGSTLARVVAPDIDLKDKKLTYFSKKRGTLAAMNRRIGRI